MAAGVNKDVNHLMTLDRAGRRWRKHYQCRTTNIVSAKEASMGGGTSTVERAWQRYHLHGQH